MDRATARLLTLIALIATTIGGLVAAFLLVPIALFSMLAVVAVECGVVKGLGLIGAISPVIVLVCIGFAWRAWISWRRRPAIIAALIVSVSALLAGALTLLGPAVC